MILSAGYCKICGTRHRPHHSRQAFCPVCSGGLVTCGDVLIALDLFFVFVLSGTLCHDPVMEYLTLFILVPVFAVGILRLIDEGVLKYNNVRSSNMPHDQ